MAEGNQLHDIPKRNNIYSILPLANIFASAYHIAMKDTEIEMIIANMTSCGCSDADTDKVRRMHEAGMDTEILQCLRSCRCTLLDELHDKQRNVDRIDSLIRTAGKLI